MPEKKPLNEIQERHAKIAIRLAIFFGCVLLLHFLLISLVFSVNDWISILVFSLLFIVPAYISNASMVFTGGGKPIDGGKSWKDGRRILGDNKTWNGLIKGPLYIGIPICVGIFLLFLALWQFIGPAYQAAIDTDLYVLYDNIRFYEYYFIGGPFPFGFLSLIIRITLCSFGACIGDLIKSFIKRRVNIKSGEPFWLADQLDLLIGVLIFLTIPAIFFPALFWMPDLNIILFLLIITPAVTIIGNTVGYHLGLKDVPW